MKSGIPSSLTVVSWIALRSISAWERVTDAVSYAADLGRVKRIAYPNNYQTYGFTALCKLPARLRLRRPL